MAWTKQVDAFSSATWTDGEGTVLQLNPDLVPALRAEAARNRGQQCPSCLCSGEDRCFASDAESFCVWVDAEGMCSACVELLNEIGQEAFVAALLTVIRPLPAFRALGSGSLFRIAFATAVCDSLLREGFTYGPLGLCDAML